MAYFADAEATRRWWEAHDWLCDCCYCENYRRAFPVAFPKGVAFLEGMGLAFDHALEICECGWNDERTARVYQAYYPVKGELTKDIVVLRETGKISLYRADSPHLHCPGVSMLPPYFVVEVQVELPWVLNEEP